MCNIIRLRDLLNSEPEGEREREWVREKKNKNWNKKKQREPFRIHETIKKCCQVVLFQLAVDVNVNGLQPSCIPHLEVHVMFPSSSSILKCAHKDRERERERVFFTELIKTPKKSFFLFFQRQPIKQRISWFLHLSWTFYCLLLSYPSSIL